ncbi:hypothetical protein HU200_015301 [Digitaria exilis]|uniref:Uncharacterized protein n=1 Tax=Digitaria exilis TaxID=1010633 RepID=A0A835FA40_9POAL|nr:hypothetical protein HU200_015301 [Digitaria exilis]
MMPFEPRPFCLVVARPSRTHKLSETTITMAAATDAAPPAAAGYGRDHIVVFPLMAKGHMLPLFHFATALTSHHGLRVTVVTTPGNLSFVRRHLLPSDSVTLAALPFPSHPELPPGVESKDALPSLALFPAFLRATALLADPFAAYLSSLPSPPLAVVSDFFLAFTQRVAADAGVRRVTLHGMSTFVLALCFSLARTPLPAEGRFCNRAGAVWSGTGQTGPVPNVPGFPEGVTITEDDVPDGMAEAADDDPVTRFMVDEIFEWEYKSWGILVNSFDELDGEYSAVLESLYVPGTRAWLVGPLFFLAACAGESSEDEEDTEGCLPWLDKQSPGSVVYVSVGTEYHVTAAQLDELGHGLIDSGNAFLWNVPSSTSDDAPWSLPASPQGKVVRGSGAWYVSHCGWDSILESLAGAGKPMLAWPGIAEQDANAKQVAEIVGAGVRVGVKAGSGEVVGRKHVAEKVREVIDAGEVGRRMRARAEQVKQAARAAVGQGGTSRLALLRLVDELQRSYDEDGQRNAFERNAEAGDDGPMPPVVERLNEKKRRESASRSATTPAQAPSRDDESQRVLYEFVNDAGSLAPEQRW